MSNLIPYNPVDGLPYGASLERGLDPAIRGDRGGPRDQRQREEDQGSGDRRGVRAAPSAQVRAGAADGPDRNRPKIGWSQGCRRTGVEFRALGMTGMADRSGRSRGDR